MLERSFYEGAIVELTITTAAVQLGNTRKAVQAIASKATTAQEAADRMGGDWSWTKLDLPEFLKEKASEFFDELFGLDYWMEIDETTRDHIEVILRDGIERGVSIRDIAKQIEEDEGYSRSRAINVARTETGGARNAGSVAAIEALGEETGLPITKEWLSTMSNTTRETHAAADGQEVPADGLFTVGDETAPYPGYHGLSAGERCNCLCSCLSGLGAAELSKDDETDAEGLGEVADDAG